MADQYVQNLHALLLQSTSPNTVALKAATATLNKDYYKNPECIPALTSIIQSSPEQGVRQLAAVELRKRIERKSGELWLLVAQNQREQIKSGLPTIALQDSVAVVRHSIARVVGAIAAIDLPNNNWPELLPVLNQACTSPEVAHREMGIYMLFTVLENIVEGFQEHLPGLFKLFEQLLVDPQSLDVRVTTVRALGTIAQYIDADEKDVIRAFQALISAMFGVVATAVDANEDAHCRHLFDVIETLLILETPLLSKSIPDLVQFTISAAANRNVDPEIRQMCLNALNWTVQYKKTRIQSQGLAGSILEGLMPIATEPEPEDVDDDCPSRSALRIIDTLATSLPPTQVFPSLRRLVTQYMQHADPNYRRAALMALGVSIEGCSEFMAPHMSQVWPVIEAGLQDPDVTVKKAACTTVGCVCEWMEEECVSRHAVLLPAVLSMIDHPVTQASACAALDALLEILGTVIDQYLDPIMNRLIGMLDTAPLKVKAVITGAIGSAAHAAKERFVPYFQPTLAKLEAFLQLTTEGEEIELRGITVDAIGTFAEAVGKDAFRPFFPHMMAKAFDGIVIGSARLKECSFLFFGVMAKVFQEEFATYLPQACSALLESLKQEEHGEGDVEVSADGNASTTGGSGDTSANAIVVVDESAIEDVDIDKLLEVNSSIAVEKEIAADTFGTIFQFTKTHFLPYLEESTLQLVSLLPHYYEGIRKSATDTLLGYIRTFYELSDPQEWVAGQAVVVPLADRVKELINHIIPALIDMYETEDHKTVATSLCSGLAETLTVVGPGLVENKLEDIGTIIAQLLEQKALCQQDPDQEEDEVVENDEDQAEYDSLLISSAGDVVSSLATVLGVDFQGALKTFLPLVSKYYTPKRNITDRSSAIGTIAEIVSGMKGAITPFTEDVFRTVMEALKDGEPEVHSNAAFAIGLLVEMSDIDLSGQFGDILRVLHPLFIVPPDALPTKFNARDNAVGAVARLITKNVSALPMDQVLPTIIGVLPLKNDFLENRPLFKALFYLFINQHTVIMPYVDQLLPVFAHVLDPNNGSEQVSDEVRAELIQLITALNNEVPVKIEASGLKVFVV